MTKAQGFRGSVEMLSADDAVMLTYRIADKLALAYEGVIPLVVKAFRGRAWQAMGYTTWADYCAAEFAGAHMLRLPADGMDAIVADMTAAGMSVRAISAALGVSVGKVHKHRPTVGEGATVISLDKHARQRQASMKRHPSGQAVPEPMPAREEPEAELYATLTMHEKAALMVDTEGPLTVHELCALTGWKQGTASCALSRAARRGLIRHSGKAREGAGIYVPF